MKKILVLLSISFLLFSCSEKIFQKKVAQPEYEASEEFVQGSEDIPLLMGMEKISEDSVGFDTDSGSIVSSNYETKLDLEKVQKFYLRTLPQMGWKLVKSEIAKATFKRENENLEIDFVNQDGKDVVKFFLSSSR